MLTIYRNLHCQILQGINFVEADELSHSIKIVHEYILTMISCTYIALYNHSLLL